jgi:hypothetical protein
MAEADIQSSRFMKIFRKSVGKGTAHTFANPYITNGRRERSTLPVLGEARREFDSPFFQPDLTPVASSQLEGGAVREYTG